MKYNYFGKYRAIVSSVESNRYNTRIKVKCPSVLGESVSAWCNPCLPFVLEKAVVGMNEGGTTSNHSHVLRQILQPPKVGDPVWVEFEGGDLSKPIWLGTWR